MLVRRTKSSDIIKCQHKVLAIIHTVSGETWTLNVPNFLPIPFWLLAESSLHLWNFHQCCWAHHFVHFVLLWKQEKEIDVKKHRTKTQLILSLKAQSLHLAYILNCFLRPAARTMALWWLNLLMMAALLFSFMDLELEVDGTEDMP